MRRATGAFRSRTIADGAIDRPTYHFHLLRVVRVAVIGLNERTAPVEDGRYDETEREHVARSAHRRLRLHFGRCNSAKRVTLRVKRLPNSSVFASLV